MRRFAALLSCSAALVASQLTEPAPAALHAFTPTADATVSAAYPKRYFGAAEHLRVRAGRPTSRVYARFNVTGLDGPVSTARLRFYITNGTRNGPAVHLTRAWPSTHITWKRQPTLSSGPRADKGRLARGTWVEWDVTPWVTGDGAYSFALRGGSADIVAFASRETKKTGKKPRLIITTPNPGPDPDPNPNPPSTVVYVAPTQGATVSGITPVRVRAPAETDWIGVYACGGESVGEDHVMGANGEWSVQWDTQTAACSNGTQDLDAWAYRDDGTELGGDHITVNVQNEPPPPPPPPGPCEPSREPGPIAGQGYTVQFADCFDTLDRTVWHNRLWYESPSPLGSQFVQGGVLHLVSKRADGYPNVTVGTDSPGTDTPQQADKHYERGYFEAQIRWTGGAGAWPGFWMLSYAHANNKNWPASPACANPNCLSAELDVLEGQGATPSDFYGTIHRNSCNCYGIANQQNANNWHPQAFRLADNWHTYAAKWTASEVSWYIDGVFSHSAPVWDSFNQQMFLSLNMWTGGWVGGTNASTPDELHTEVDWIRVWQQ